MEDGFLFLENLQTQQRVFQQNGRSADFRCGCKPKWAAQRKRTLRVVIQFFRCANAANGGSEPKAEVTEVCQMASA